jgi:Zn-dependent M28 family amino/carboxypeptidase
VGIGQPIDGDRIYNGAMDDASGVASLIEIARGFRERGVGLKRTVVFAAVAAEEKGLLGSRYFAVHPTAAADRIVANINLDMYLPIHPLRILTVYGLDESTLGDDIRAAAKERGVEVEPDPEPLRNIFIRSDQYSFIRQGVPAVFFKFGYEEGSAEEKLQKEWLKNRYHAPSDDTRQPVDLEGAAKLNEIIAALTEQVANAEARPAWKDTSFFKRFAVQ